MSFRYALVLEVFLASDVESVLELPCRFVKLGGGGDRGDCGEGVSQGLFPLFLRGCIGTSFEGAEEGSLISLSW
jgi:hypothetical protein